MSQGIIGGPRHYDGPKLGDGPWKCPACAAENVGPLDQGCTSCGSGSARPYKVATPPPDLKLDARKVPGALAQAEAAGAIRELPSDEIVDVASLWVERHPEATPVEAFRAGYLLALQQSQARTMAAPPVSVDVRELAPEGKPRRTIIAALELFKDQVLRDATDEIASGEWLTIEETEQLIQQLREEEEKTT